MSFICGYAEWYIPRTRVPGEHHHITAISRLQKNWNHSNQSPDSENKYSDCCLGGTFVQVDENYDDSNGFYDEMSTVDTKESKDF
jgi:hypothetical protein